MKIRVVVHAGLWPNGADSPHVNIEVEPGATLAAVLTALGIDVGLLGVASSGARLISPQTSLEEDCVIDVYPLFGGG